MEYEKQLDRQASRALKSAQKTAGKLGRTLIGTEHLLLSMACQRYTSSGRILHAAGVSGRRLKRKLTARYGWHLFGAKPERVSTHLKMVLEQAGQNGSGCVGTENLLVAILECQGCEARRLMEEMETDMSTLEQLTGIKILPDRKIRMAGSRSGTSTLDKYASDLTEMAREGKLDPVIGREEEVFRVLTILSRRTKNNPVLLGDPGVGKTAIAEALAQAIVDGAVPEELRGARIMALDMASMVSGTKYRGEFEERMRNVVRELKANEHIIVFIDEVHTLVGAGAAEGAIDAANLLKPALARGEIRLIGTTTVEEYHKTIEKDAALDRRFQRVDVREPDAETAEDILKGIAPRYEKHHRVQMAPGVIHEAVQLSIRISPERFLPDKAIDLMDEACAAVHLQGRTVVLLEDIKQTAQRSRGIGLPYQEEFSRLIQLEQELSRRIVGQADAVARICRAVRRGESGLRAQTRPRAALLLTGPTGVGKTSVCEQLASLLFGRESLIRIDLTEFQQSHDMARLLGAPPGYKGYGEGGQLTEKIRRHPRSVVLFDEVEKAHPDVLRVLLRLLEDGRLTDAEGRSADFRHAVIVLTANLGDGVSRTREVGFSRFDSSEERTTEEVRRVLSTELTARLDDVIPFVPLNKPDCVQIAEQELKTLAQRCELCDVVLEWEDAVPERLGIVDVRRGARAVRDIVAKQVADPLAAILLGEQKTDAVRLCVQHGELQLIRKTVQRV